MTYSTPPIEYGCHQILAPFISRIRCQGPKAMQTFKIRNNAENPSMLPIPSLPLWSNFKAALHRYAKQRLPPEQIRLFQCPYRPPRKDQEDANTLWRRPYCTVIRVMLTSGVAEVRQRKLPFCLFMKRSLSLSRRLLTCSSSTSSIEIQGKGILGAAQSRLVASSYIHCIFSPPFSFYPFPWWKRQGRRFGVIMKII